MYVSSHTCSVRMKSLPWILLFALLIFCIQETSTCKSKSTCTDLVSVKISRSQWKTLIQWFITSISTELPEVGKSVNLLISLFWPEGCKPDIFETIKSQVEELVDTKIFDFELKTLQGEINGIQLDLSSYNASLMHEKGTYLTAILTKCNSLFSRIEISDNRHQLVPVLVTLGMIHLNMLRERSLFGKRIFGEDNQQVWDGELKRLVDQYQKTLKQLYLEWIKWRKAKILTFSRPSKTPPMPMGDHAEGIVTDTLTNRKIAWQDWGNQKDIFAPAVLIQKQSWFSVANSDYFSIYSKSFNFPKFIPLQEQRPPTIPTEFEILEVGPLYWDDPKGDSDHSNRPKSPTNWDEPGTIAGILIREYNTIDGLQIKYNDHDGNFVGDPSGGVEHIHTLRNDKRITAISMGFNNRGLVELTLTDSDGRCETPSTYGNKGDWKLRRTTFYIPDFEGYMISSVAMSTDNNMGLINAVHFKFKASRNYLETIPFPHSWCTAGCGGGCMGWRQLPVRGSCSYNGDDFSDDYNSCCQPCCPKLKGVSSGIC